LAKWQSPVRDKRSILPSLAGLEIICWTPNPALKRWAIFRKILDGQAAATGATSVQQTKNANPISNRKTWTNDSKRLLKR
jgi:hypothetical protein